MSRRAGRCSPRSSPRTSTPDERFHAGPLRLAVALRLEPVHEPI